MNSLAPLLYELSLAKEIHGRPGYLESFRQTVSWHAKDLRSLLAQMVEARPDESRVVATDWEQWWTKTRAEWVKE